VPSATLCFLLFIYKMDGRLVLPLVPFYDAVTSARSTVAGDMIVVAFFCLSLFVAACRFEFLPPGAARVSGNIVATFRML
jgi:hypothetical protein